MCPAKIQEVVVDFFYYVSLDPLLSKILYETEGSLRLVVEVLRQGMRFCWVFFLFNQYYSL
jgi:hypothetical protein